MLLGGNILYLYHGTGGKRVVEDRSRHDHSILTPRNLDIIIAVDPEEEHLVFRGTLEGKDVRIIIDYRANTSYITARIGKELSH